MACNGDREWRAANDVNWNGEVTAVNGLYYSDWFEVYATNLALAVAQHSHEVSVIVRETAPEFQGRRMDADESRRTLQEGIAELHVSPGRYWSMKSVVGIQRILRSKRYDFFHIQQTGDPRFLWAAWRLPTVLTLHEPSPRQGDTNTRSLRKVFSPVIQRAYRSLAKAIVVHTRSSFELLSDRERRKAVVIPHGVRISTPPVNPSPTSKTVLFFGRAARYKGIDTLLAAMDIVWEADPLVRLQILASPADRECEVRELDDRISATWEGYSESDLDLALAGAHVVCLPYSTASGTGVGTRAYGAGKPLVASDLEGLREFVVDPDLIFQPGDVDDLARALKSALSRDFSRQEIDPSRAWPAVASAHISIYESIASPV